MRNFCSLEPAKKKVRCEGVFGGGAVVPERRALVDASSLVRLQDQKALSTKTCCCHVCDNVAVEITPSPKSATAADSFSGQSSLTQLAKAKQTKSHSLLNYFPKSKLSTKKPAFKSSTIGVDKQFSPIKESQISCHYCDKLTCQSCIRQCELCSGDFCTFCSKVDYRGVVEKILCFECVNEEYVSAGGDVDMMDL